MKEIQETFAALKERRAKEVIRHLNKESEALTGRHEQIAMKSHKIKSVNKMEGHDTLLQVKMNLVSWNSAISDQKTFSVNK